MWPFQKRTIQKHKRRRFYNAAAISRLTNSWAVNQSSTSDELKASLRILRSRSRDLARNNDYVARYLNLVRVNVVGHMGIVLQSKITDPDGSQDEAANRKIESGWSAWGKRGVCEISGKLSWLDCQALIITSVVRDGEILIRKHTGQNINKFGFAIELIDPDLLDENYNKNLGNGHEIRMGIEFDSLGRVVAYHIFKKHPSNSLAIRERKRIPAKYIEHAFFIERVGQERGVPRLVTAMTRLKMLDGYEEAELVASRTGAATMGVLVSPDSEAWSSNPDDGDDDDDDMDISFEAEPGTFRALPEGYDLRTFDPNHPSTAFADFEKAILRGIASGLNVSYVGLANDLEGVSYSSIRQGELADRDNWRVMQQWLVGAVISPVWDAWLDNALLGGSVDLPHEKIDKFNRPSWHPRGWAWVDPQKEIAANKEAVKAGFKSVSDIITEQGRDPDDVFARIAKDKAAAEKYGIVLDVILEELSNETRSA